MLLWQSQSTVTHVPAQSAEKLYITITLIQGVYPRQRHQYNGWMNGWKDDRLVDRRMEGRVNGWTKRRVNEGMNGHM